MKISFVLPSFNSVTWLPTAVGSVLGQTHKDIECVVVNDGSTDATSDYLAWQAQKDTRLVVVNPGKNIGRSAARNLGNDTATGEVICVLDADDLAYPGRARVVAERFSKGAEFLYGSAVAMDACGRNLGEIKAEPFSREKALETKENKIVHSSVAYTKDFAKRFPYSDGEIARLGIDDYEQQVRAFMAGVKMEHTTETIAAYRILDSAITKTRNEDEVKKFKTGYLEALTAMAK